MIKTTSSRIIIISVIVVALVQAGIIVMQNGKLRDVFNTNRELIAEMQNITKKLSASSEELNKQSEDLKKQNADLEATRNRLTQERLKNTQLMQTIEQLQPKADLPSEDELPLLQQ